MLKDAASCVLSTCHRGISRRADGITDRGDHQRTSPPPPPPSPPHPSLSLFSLSFLFLFLSLLPPFPISHKTRTNCHVFLALRFVCGFVPIRRFFHISSQESRTTFFNIRILWDPLGFLPPERVKLSFCLFICLLCFCQGFLGIFLGIFLRI